MRNISVRIILAVLLVASLGCAGEMKCKTEWVPQVKMLAQQVQWTSGRVADIRRHPKRYVCATFYTVEGNQVYAAVEKEPNGDLVIVINKETGWDYMHLTYVEPINEFGIVTVDAYGIKNATTLPSKYYADMREKLRNSISDDADCPDSWKTNGVCDPEWYTWGKIDDTPQEVLDDVPNVKGASSGLAGDCPESWRDSYGLCKREWFN